MSLDAEFAYGSDHVNPGLIYDSKEADYIKNCVDKDMGLHFCSE